MHKQRDSMAKQYSVCVRMCAHLLFLISETAKQVVVD